MNAAQNIKAIFKKEWNSYFYSPVAYVFIVFFIGAAAFFVFQFDRYYEARQANLQPFFFWHQWLFLFFVPAISMRLWSEERRSHTIELLFTLPITSFQSVLGKFLAAWGLLIMTLTLSTIAMVCTTEFLGKPDYGVVFTGWLGSVLIAGAFLAVGLFTSALAKNQVISFILGLVIIFFALMLSGLPPVTDLLTRMNLPVWVVSGISQFSVISQSESLQRGLIDFRSLFYFLSVIAFMLFSTNVVIQRKAAR